MESPEEAKDSMEKERVRRVILKAQQAEITEHHIYKRLAEITGEGPNHDVLQGIADDELKHYEFWRKHTGKHLKPERLKVWVYIAVARIFGLSFGLRLMESGEELAQKVYADLAQHVPGADAIAQDENQHESECIGMLDEESLRYASSMVLGLNDALVELTGAIAGLTFALQKTGLVAIAALVTGISASLSMAGSEYLSTKTEEREGKDPLKASLYTGVAYVAAVAALIFPYFVLPNAFHALAWTLANAVLIILFFTYYISVARAYSFRRRFGEMVAISMGVAVISFLIGLLVRRFLGIEA